MYQLAKGTLSVLRSLVPKPSLNVDIRNLVEKPVQALTPKEKAELVAWSSFMALSNPYSGSGVAILGEISGEQSLKSIRERMLQSESGRDILQLRKPIFTSQIKEGNFQEGTLGRILQNCVPEERLPVKYVADSELAFIMRRYRDAHDVIHALTGFPVTVAGEVALKWFECASTRLPMTTLAAVFGILRSENHSSQLLVDWIPWASTAGKHGEFYLSIQYDQFLEWQVDEFRTRVLKWPAFPESLTNKNIIKEHYREAIAQAVKEGRDAVALTKEMKHHLD